MTEDSVRRLAEIRVAYERADDFTRARMDNVKWMLDLIDSLTAERDRALGTAMTFSKATTVVLARAEAAEADRERLREALSVVHECAEKRLDDIPPYPKRIDEMNEAEVAIQNVAAHCCGALVFIEQYARAALATPPSEGEQS